MQAGGEGVEWGVQEAWQVFDLTPKMRCTKVSLIRNVKMMKTNLLKACVTHSLPATLHLSAVKVAMGHGNPVRHCLARWLTCA